MPDAYATALPGLYIPLLVMIFALIFRGFAVEMTLHRASRDRTWTRLFGVGSLVAAFAQGVLFGGLLCGSPSATSCSPARRGTSSGTATRCSPAW